MNLMGIWNQHCAEKLGPVTEATEGRVVAAYVAKKKKSDLSWWDRSAQAVARSEFLCGGGERGFVATFDWWVRYDKASRALEGAYGHVFRRAEPEEHAPPAHLRPANGLRERLESRTISTAFEDVVEQEWWRSLRLLGTEAGAVWVAAPNAAVKALVEENRARVESMLARATGQRIKVYAVVKRE